MLIFIWTQRRRQDVLSHFADINLARELAGNYDGRLNRIKQTLLVFVLIFSIIALARPQWGFEWQKIKREGIDILIAIDTSKSMLAQDIRPNRLERAKLALRDLLHLLSQDRLGIIAFAGDAFLACPLTVDYNGVLLTLENLDTQTIPRGGTNIAMAIQEAMKEYDSTPSKYKAIIIITDGENLEGEPLTAARQARNKGIKIFTVGIGTQEGELIQIQDQEGNNVFLKDKNGNFVKSRLNEDVLQKIALETGGIYVKASGAQLGLDLIYKRELSKFEKRELKARMEKRYFERFQFPLAIALVLLMIDICLVPRKKVMA